MTLEGELDKLTSETAGAELDRAVGGGRVLVDLSSVTFLDSAGLHTLFRTARAVAKVGGQVGVAVPPESPVRRVLEITHVSGVATVYDSVAEGTLALRDVSPLAGGGTPGDDGDR